jgi:hypothetical protein
MAARSPRPRSACRSHNNLLKTVAGQQSSVGTALASDAQPLCSCPVVDMFPMQERDDPRQESETADGERASQGCRRSSILRAAF